MSSLPLLAPPAHSRRLLTWDLTHSAELQTVRTGIQRHFTAAGEPGADLADRVALVATELAGNALRHGRPPIVVRLLRDPVCYILDVSDHDPDHAPRLAAPGGRIHAGGRGLTIARSLADQVCWHRSEHAKQVWASFAAPGGPTPAHPAPGDPAATGPAR